MATYNLNRFTISQLLLSYYIWHIRLFTLMRISQLLAYNFCFTVTPAIITYGVPPTRKAHFHYSFIQHSTIKQSDVSLTAFEFPLRPEKKFAIDSYYSMTYCVLEICITRKNVR